MIIGITGTIGAGKGTVVDYLVKQKGYTHYSVREELIHEIERRGLPVNRPNMNEVATDLREKHAPSYFTKVFLERAERDGVTDAVMESIRNPEEAKNIKAHGGVIWVVDADRKMRYERIKSRASVTDQVSYEEFCAQEDREMTSEDPSNPAKMSVRGVMEMADVTLLNEGTLEELHLKIQEALQQYA